MKKLKIQIQQVLNIIFLETVFYDTRPVYTSGIKPSHPYKGDTYQNGSTEALLFSLIFSKEYGFCRFFNSLKGIPFSLENLGRCLKGIDYFTHIPQVEIPVYFFSGEHDYLTPQNILTEYYEVCSLIFCCRMMSGTFISRSCCFRMSMICSSVIRFCIISSSGYCFIILEYALSKYLCLHLLH